MKSTNRSTLTIATLVVALAASAVAIAQPAPGRVPGTMGTNTAVQPGSRALERFKATDVDKDGTLSNTEVEQGMPRMSTYFASLDTNQDGKISVEEFQTAKGSMRPAGVGFQSGGRGMKAVRGPGRGACMMNDANKDGVISRAEAAQAGRPRMLQRFDALDTNKDGQLNAEERAAGCPMTPKS